jgi:DNA-binding winged helix-turn-helix (wHTH) protein
MDVPASYSAFSFGEFRFDRRGGGLFRAGDDGAWVGVPLGSRALDLLELLLERRGEIVAKSEIMELVWSGIVVDDANLAVQISALRRAFDQKRSNGGWIETVPGRGYRFIAPVRRLTADPIDGSPDPDPEQSSAASATGSLVVGRAAPSRALDDLLKRALDGNRRLVFITGEAGIGKTTLLDITLERVPRDVGVLRGHCTEMFGTREPFLPLIEAVQTACRGPHGPALSRALRDHAPAWLAQMPGLLDVNDRAAFQAEIFGATRERMVREFCEFLEAICVTRPWIVVLEDLHWSDLATLDALSRLARRDRTAALLVLATYRPADVQLDGHPVLKVHQDLRLRGYCDEVPLDRLSQMDVEQYLALRFADAGLAEMLSERIFHRTKGHPLFVVALVNHFIEHGAIRKSDGHWRVGERHLLAQKNIPRDARDMLGRQIERLTVDDQRLLEVASAAGAEFSAAEVAGAIGGNVLMVEQSFEQLARKGHILNAAGLAVWPNGTSAGRYGFQHALYQEVLYQRLAPGLRIQLHRRLGESLEAGYHSRTGEVAAILALHFEEGRSFAKAIQYLTQAAENAARRFATREAVRDLTRALELTRHLAGADQFMARIRLLRLRGWALRSAGDLAGSLEDLRTMISYAASAGLLDLEATGLMDLSRFSLFADRRLCLPAAEQALALCEKLADPALAALIRASTACTKLQLMAWRDDDAALYRHSVSLAAATSDPALIMRREAIESTFACITGDYAICRTASARGKAMALRAGDTFLYALHNILESYSLIQVGALGEVRRQTTAALAMAEKNGNAVASAFCGLTSGWLHTESLDFAGAVRVCEANHNAALDANPFIHLWRRTILAKSRLGMRDYASAWNDLSAIAEQSSADDDHLDYPIRVELHVCLCEFWIAAGDWRQARAQATLLRTIASRAPDRHYLALAHRFLARVAMAQNNLNDARTHVSDAVSTLEHVEFPLAAWRVYATAAECQECAGDLAAAAEYRSRSHGIVQTLVATFDLDDPLRLALLTGAAPETGSPM